MIWTLFPGKQQARDFLWRAAGNGRFYILSAREPLPSSLFLPLETKPFDPEFIAGETLGFALRANATRDQRSARGEAAQAGSAPAPVRGRRVDIVGHTVRERRGSGVALDAGIRHEIAQEAARDWLGARGERHGFDLEQLVVDHYRMLRPNRLKGAQASFGILDMSGILTVRDPLSFARALVSGFGRAKAFGCGLMLVRRIHPPWRE